ncbi:MAG: hypothetical protein K1X94_13825 [Sandaracinaceae bacterium]|nr:hypothetical protein [Sandaracinaceae bacterium]
MVSSPTRRSITCALALALAGCGDPPMGSDAGPADDASRDGAIQSARVSVSVVADPSTLEDDTTLERLVIGVLDVRAPNDRGVLAGHVDRALDLTSGAAELTLPDAPPAVYGEVELFLGPGAWGPAMVFEIQEPSRHIVLELDRRVELEGRCDMPHELGTSGGLGMTVNVDIALIAHVLRESELPAPVDGVIHVDATSAPAVIAEILASFERLELECADYDL